ncbi:hypothetical protein ADICYQ_2490 [Cyclobacterium qasimii M12-11B]|uniref:Uncharacterized protein n=1 Tax=Cyclobacterium qasimii M12-11B TaxID=641524 RepID=S7WP72_9BACT|nr:hypothetical protein ADICYQ_2490 [Cyclobacterium qasimii M12-11B]
MEIIGFVLTLLEGFVLLFLYQLYRSIKSFAPFDPTDFTLG